MHRKGATWALGPGHPELPDPTCHGPAGRSAGPPPRRSCQAPDLRRKLEGEGVVLAAANWKLLSKEDANR
jgi:hypothetical protein